jgi:hypothetical protein
MGEHWVNGQLVVQGEVDPLHPPILEYVTIDGKPTLAGVAYTELVRDGPPRSRLPAPPSAWHFHEGSVDDESFLLAHEEAITDPRRGPRVAVLHAWIFLENPAGLFTTDNWSLPWRRLGLAPPAGIGESSPAALAAALAAGGEGYFLTVLRLRHRLDSDGAERAKAILGRHATNIRSVIRGAIAEGRPPPMAELARAWEGAEREVEALCAGCSLRLTRHHSALSR